MRQNNTPASRRNEAAELLRRVQEYKPARGEFSYAEYGRAAAEAQHLFKKASWLAQRFPVNADYTAAVKAARQLWDTAMQAAYPPGFWEDVQKLRAGDAAGLEAAIRFLEADPMFFGTGYEKAMLIRAIKPSMLTPSDIRRLQSVILSLVDRRDERDFRAFCRLARKVDEPELREGLAQRLTSHNPDTSPALDVRRRARWVLEALARKDEMEAAVEKKKHHGRGSQAKKEAE